ncbi:precorrin isomerase [Candidatus Methanoperedens nitroreducens]|uniref:Precorrin isomerase n=1 Tax=Candidatus Methanoperedens nitratireducens TaxID=1392998 RepID=A0A062V7P1_9EURY|nr:precorrin-8X methylmutase [Candidatus Methanoperedens nitroreducens]KCZ71789.1 precorrin isomerase [Candidatus Methanoperedens nitroreducens]MDJ1422237.1 precorrin-8X methylmutase [Candidatus Methanoperedens sp.]
MNTDLGAHTREAQEISKKSRMIVRSIVGGDTPEDRIRQRCVIATGDPAFADLMRFSNNPIEAGIKAIREGVTIFTDIKMAQVGITKRGHNCRVRCVLDSGDEIARRTGMTRTSAGFMALEHELDGAIIVIGNAPSAAMTVCGMIEQGLRPALLVATPVGFVNAAESKERVRGLDVPSITCIGTRGGTPVAVAVVNELVEF